MIPRNNLAWDHYTKQSNAHKQQWQNSLRSMERKTIKCEAHQDIWKKMLHQKIRWKNGKVWLSCGKMNTCWLLKYKEIIQVLQSEVEQSCGKHQCSNWWNRWTIIKGRRKWINETTLRRRRRRWRRSRRIRESSINSSKDTYKMSTK